MGSCNPCAGFLQEDFQEPLHDPNNAFLKKIFLVRNLFFSKSGTREGFNLQFSRFLTEARISSRLMGSFTSTSRALLPSKGPMILAASSWSMILPARLYPSFSFRWRREAEPCWLLTMSTA